MKSDIEFKIKAIIDNKMNVYTHSISSKITSVLDTYKDYLRHYEIIIHSIDVLGMNIFVNYHKTTEESCAKYTLRLEDFIEKLFTVENTRTYTIREIIE